MPQRQAKGKGRFVSSKKRARRSLGEGEAEGKGTEDLYSNHTGFFVFFFFQSLFASPSWYVTLESWRLVGPVVLVGVTLVRTLSLVSLYLSISALFVFCVVCICLCLCYQTRERAPWESSLCVYVYLDLSGCLCLRSLPIIH